jgi:uncharacterized membrane protein
VFISGILLLTALVEFTLDLELIYFLVNFVYFYLLALSGRKQTINLEEPDISIAISLALMVISFICALKTMGELISLYLIGIGLAIILTQIRKDILGKWTKEGRIVHEKLNRYKKFMKELTLMKEKKITDIILWEKLLVYATAFGVADKVKEALKIHHPNYSKEKRLNALTFISVSLPLLVFSARRPSSYAAGVGLGGFGGGGGGGGGGGAR